MLAVVPHELSDNVLHICCTKSWLFFEVFDAFGRLLEKYWIISVLDLSQQLISEGLEILLKLTGLTLILTLIIILFLSFGFKESQQFLNILIAFFTDKNFISFFFAFLCGEVVLAQIIVVKCFRFDFQSGLVIIHWILSSNIGFEKVGQGRKKNFSSRLRRAKELSFLVGEIVEMVELFTKLFDSLCSCEMFFEECMERLSELQNLFVHFL